MIPAARILLVLHGAIGDVVRALPLVNRVRDGYPTARIAWAVEPLAAPLVRGHLAVDECLVFDRAKGPAAVIAFLRRVRQFRPDLVLDLQRHLKSGVISRVSGAAVRVGFHRRNTREGNWLFNNRYLPAVAHLSSKLGHYLLFADVLGLPPAPVRFDLFPSDEDRARVDTLLGPAEQAWVAMFVGASWPSRVWFAEPAAAVLRELSERGFSPLLVGGPGDVDRAAEIERLVPGAVRNLVGRTQLRDLIEVFGRSRVAIGPDSGPMHLAAAVGCRVVSLWGATSALRSGPYGNEDLAVQGEAPCTPCYRRRCPIGRVCMQSITATAVIDKVTAGLAASAHDGSRI